MAIDDAPPTLHIGGEAQTLSLHSVAQHREAVTALCAQFRRGLAIASRQLDPRVFDDDAVMQAMKRSLLDNRRARVRLLVQDIEPMVRHGHRLLSLYRRMSSFIDIRVPAREHRDYNEALLLVDDIAYLHQEHADHYRATLCLNAPAATRDYSRTFDAMWEKATRDSNLLELKL